MSDRAKKKAAASEGRFAYEGLDRAIHEKARLGILTSLAAHPNGLPFGELKELCSLTDGNLNRHLAVLEDARLIDANRTSGRGRPQTTVILTASGRHRFEQYIAVLEQVVVDALAGQQSAAERRKAKPLAGYQPA